jgi:hypothetical protein
MLKCLWCGRVYNIGEGINYCRKCAFCNGSIKLRERYLRRLKRKKEEEKAKKVYAKTTIKKGLPIVKQHYYNFIKKVCELAHRDIQELDLTQELNYQEDLDYYENINRAKRILREKGFLTTEIEAELGLFDFDSSFEQFLHEYKSYYGEEYKEQGNL